MAREPYEFEPLFNEDEQSILGRILDPFVTDPDPERRFSTRAGGFLHDFATIVSLEFYRAYERLNMTAAVSFLVGAFGDYLDQKGIELNLPRKGAVAATVNITVEAAPDLIIPAGTRFTTTSVGDEEEVPVEFATVATSVVGASGVAVVSALSTVPGVFGNVPAHTITQMVDVLDGVIYITNEFDSVGGVDEEDDDDYRGRLLDALAAAGGPGAKADYRVWAAEIPGVSDSIVFPHWDGGGTVKVVLLGPDVSVPATATVRTVQEYLDPSIVLLASMDPDEAWQGATFVTTSKAEGTSSLQVNADAEATTTPRLERDEDLAYITTADVFSVWVDLVSPLANLQDVIFRIEDDEGLVALVTIPSTSFVAGPQDIFWTLADMTVPGGFDWANVRAVEISVTSTAIGASVVRFDSMRVRDANGSVGQGRAPIGAQVTVVPARLLPLDVSVTLVPAPGFTHATIATSVAASLDAYFDSRRSSTEYVYLSEIANVINDTPGVLTYYDVQINGSPTDLPIEAQDIPVLTNLVTS